MPKFETIVANKSAWATLTPAQQAAIREAAANTLSNAGEVPQREAGQLSGLCSAGLVLDQPSPAQLATLAQEANRTATLSPAASAMVEQIQATIPGTGPQLSAIPTPLRCHVAHTTAQAKSLSSLDVHQTNQCTATIPPGTYVTTITPEEFSEFAHTPPSHNPPSVFYHKFYPDGKISEIINKKGQPPIIRGRYVVNCNVLTIYWNRAAHLTPETVRWSYYKGQLSFEIIHTEDSAAPAMYTAHPWRKIGTVRKSVF
jgi:hypothetical protein